MKLSKAPAEMIALFEAVCPGPPVTPRKMFGYPAAFINGNMFMGLFADQMMLRLDDTDRARLLEEPGVAIFEPMPGRPMREYVTLSRAILNDRAELKKWIGRSLDYAQSLPAKKKPAASGKTRSKENR
jgi:TfoX/Sxy family transcriptional regulator of competence genes